MKLNKALLCSATAFACLSSSGRVLAADTSITGPTVGEVVITARKRSESLQKVPVAVTTQTGLQLAQRGIREVTDLGTIVPSLTVTIANAQPSAAAFSLRGQSSPGPLLTLSQPVGVYEDSVNIPHPTGLNGAFFDVQRVEVLKGPQGTLYGRNTTGGAVNIITRNADYNGYHGFASAEVGDYNDWKLGGAANLPIIDNVLSARISYQHWSRDGFGKSLTTGETLGDDHDDDVARLSVRFDPTSYFTSSTKLEFVNLNEHGYLTTLVAVPQGSHAPFEAAAEGGSLTPWLDDKDIFQNGDEAHVLDKVRTFHFAQDMTWNIDADTKLRSITGYHSVHDNNTTDLDSTPFQILEVGAGAGQVQPIAPNGPYPHSSIPEAVYNAWTQEFDLSGHSFGRLDWLVGAFGSWEDGSGGEPNISFGDLTHGAVSTTTLSNDETTDTWAIFTQNDIHVSDRVFFTLGARYTNERETDKAQLFNWADTGGAGTYSCNGAGVPAGNNPGACPYVAQAIESNGISYLASFNFQITPATLFYLKTSRGYRGGGLQFRAPALPGVKPEFATDYEAGLKSELFEHRLRINLAVYHTNYINKQEEIVENFCGSEPLAPAPFVCSPSLLHSSTVLFNAANAHVDGAEGEFTAIPVRGWTINASLTYLRGVYDSYPSALNPDGVALSSLGETGNGQLFPDPQWRYNIGTRYEHEVGPGMLGGQLDWSWRAHQNATPLDISPTFSTSLQKSLYAAVGLLNGRVDYTLPNKGITVALFVTNLLDKHYQTLSLFSSALGIGTAQTQDPRMFGINFTKSFGSE